jgi:hypothetical protein
MGMAQGLLSTTIPVSDGRSRVIYANSATRSYLEALLYRGLRSVRLSGVPAALLNVGNAGFGPELKATDELADLQVGYFLPAVPAERRAEVFPVRPFAGFADDRLLSSRVEDELLLGDGVGGLEPTGGIETGGVLVPYRLSQYEGQAAVREDPHRGRRRPDERPRTLEKWLESIQE